MSIFQSAYPIGWFCIVPLTGNLILNYGWRNAWLLLGIAFILIVIASSFFIEEPKKSYTNVPSNNKSSKMIPMKTRFFIIVGIIIMFICGFTDVPFSQLWIPISIEWGINEVAASHALGYMAAMAFIGTIFIGPLPGKFGYKVPFALFYVIRAASLIPPIFLIKSVTAYYAFMILLGLSFFGMAPIFSSWIGEVFGEKFLGELLGLSTFIHYVGAALGVYIFSLINDIYKTYYPVFLLSLILALTIIACCHLIRPPKE